MVYKVCSMCGELKDYCAKGLCKDCYHKKRREDNQERVREIAMNSYHKNKEKWKLNRKKDNPEKKLARLYAQRNQRKDYCGECGSTDKLHFHHSDYIKREGHTLCKECHLAVHKA